MSDNDDRIAKWRARRQAAASAREAHGDLPSWLALTAARAQSLAGRPIEDVDALLAAVVAGIAESPHATTSDRRAIYDALGRGLEHGVREADLEQTDAETRRVLLRIAIRLVEADFRADIDVTRAGYRPREFNSVTAPMLQRQEGRRRQAATKDAKAARRRATLEDKAYAVEMSPGDEADLAHIRANQLPSPRSCFRQA